MYPGSCSTVFTLLIAEVVCPAVRSLRCILLCRRLLKKLRWLLGFYINTDKNTAQAVLDGLHSRSFILYVPGRCRRPLPGVTATGRWKGSEYSKDVP